MLRTTLLSLAGAVAVQAIPHPTPTVTPPPGDLSAECSVNLFPWRPECHLGNGQGDTIRAGPTPVPKPDLGVGCDWDGSGYIPESCHLLRRDTGDIINGIWDIVSRILHRKDHTKTKKPEHSSTSSTFPTATPTKTDEPDGPEQPTSSTSTSPVPIPTETEEPKPTHTTSSSSVDTRTETPSDGPPTTTSSVSTKTTSDVPSMTTTSNASSSPTIPTATSSKPGETTSQSSTDTTSHTSSTLSHTTTSESGHSSSSQPSSTPTSSTPASSTSSSSTSASSTPTSSTSASSTSTSSTSASSTPTSSTSSSSTPTSSTSASSTGDTSSSSTGSHSQSTSSSVTTTQSTTATWTTETRTATSSTVVPIPTHKPIEDVTDVVESLRRSEKEKRDLKLGLGLGLGLGIPGALLAGWIANTLAHAGATTVLAPELPGRLLGNTPDWSGATTFDYTDLSSGSSDWTQPTNEQISQWLDDTIRAGQGSSGPGGGSPGTPGPPGGGGTGPPGGGGSGPPGGGEPSNPGNGKGKEREQVVQREDWDTDIDDGGGSPGSGGDQGESYSENLGSDVANSFDRWYQELSKRIDGLTLEQLLEIFEQIQVDLANAEAATASNPGGVSSGASSVVEQAVNAAANGAGGGLNPDLVKSSPLVKRAARIVAEASKSLGEISNALIEAGVPAADIAQTRDHIATTIDGVPQAGRYDAALNALGDVVTTQDLAIAEAGDAATHAGGPDAIRHALRKAGFPEDALAPTMKAVHDAVYIAISNGAHAVGSAVKAIREAFPPGGWDTASGSLQDPSVKKALLDVIRASYNFWPQYANAIYDTLKKLERESPSKTVEDLLANGPPPKMPPYRDIFYPYRRGRLQGPGKDPLAVKPGEGYDNETGTNSTVPWFCANQTSEEIRESAEKDGKSVSDGLAYLNSHKRDEYLSSLKVNQDKVARLLKAVPIAICRQRNDPESVKMTGPGRMSYDDTHQALLMMWKAVLDVKTTPTEATKKDFCANLTSEQSSVVEKIDKESLSGILNQFDGVNQTGLEQLARDDPNMFRRMRVWSLPIAMCRLQKDLESSTLSESEKTEYQKSLELLGELSWDMDDINDTPQDPIEVPKLWLPVGPTCPDFDPGRAPPNRKITEERYHNYQAYKTNLSQALDVFDHHEDEYLIHMKFHPDEIATTLEALEDGECLMSIAERNIGIWKWPDFIPMERSKTLRTMLKALREIKRD